MAMRKRMSHRKDAKVFRRTAQGTARANIMGSTSMRGGTRL